MIVNGGWRTFPAHSQLTMSQATNPVQPPAAPPREAAVQSAPPATSSGNAQAGLSADQIWKLVALGVALLILAVSLFYLISGPTADTAQEEEEYTTEEEEPKAPPATTPPPAFRDDVRPMPQRNPDRLKTSAPKPALPPMHVLSVGFSHVPSLRVVALRIGGALPYFMHEGETIGDIKILAIMADRVQISHAGTTYEIKIGD